MLEVDLQLKSAFPKLDQAGGYSLCRTETGRRKLVTLRGPYSTEIIKDSVGQGKIFIRPLQCNLSMEPVESVDEVRISS